MLIFLLYFFLESRSGRAPRHGQSAEESAPPGGPAPSKGGRSQDGGVAEALPGQDLALAWPD